MSNPTSSTSSHRQPARITHLSRVSHRRIERYDVVIVGAGAAGLMCAAEAGKRGRRALVLEHADRVGKKILISGGGRCNFTNRWAVPEDYQSGNIDGNLLHIWIR